MYKMSLGCHVLMVKTPQLIGSTGRMLVILNQMGLVCSVELLTSVLVPAPLPYQKHILWSGAAQM